MFLARPTPSTAEEPPHETLNPGRSRSVRTRNPEIVRFRFPDVQLHILGSMLTHRPRMTASKPPRSLQIKGLHMPAILDPDAAAVFKAFQEAGRPPYETVGHAEARRLYLAGRVVSNPEPPELESINPLSIPAPHGSIPARIYTPKNPRQADGLAPALCSFTAAAG